MKVVQSSFVSTPFAIAFFTTNYAFDRLNYLPVLIFISFLISVMSDLHSEKTILEDDWPTKNGWQTDDSEIGK